MTTVSSASSNPVENDMFQENLALCDSSNHVYVVHCNVGPFLHSSRYLILLGLPRISKIGIYL